MFKRVKHKDGIEHRCDRTQMEQNTDGTEHRWDRTQMGQNTVGIEHRWDITQIRIPKILQKFQGED